MRKTANTYYPPNKRSPPGLSRQNCCKAPSNNCALHASEDELNQSAGAKSALADKDNAEISNAVQ